jgi:hypothetical protein
VSPDPNEQRRAHWAANREQINERRREQRAVNPDKVREQKRAYKAANREQVNERQRRWYAANAEQERERDRRWREANREQINERRRQLRAANRDKINEQQRQRRAASRDRDNERQRRWYAANRDKINELERQRRAANPEQGRAKRYRGRHGLWPHQWQALYDAQDGLCYLCGEPLSDDPRMVGLDHDHRCCPRNRSCSQCRLGLCHHECNAALGMVGDDPARLMRIARNRVKAQRRLGDLPKPLTLFDYTPEGNNP